MRKLFIQAMLISVLIITGCATVPITGRKQLDMIPDNEMLSMSLSQYKEFLNNHEISTDRKKVDMVKRVGERIQKGVNLYFSERGMGGRLKDYQWEFNLVESEEVNAWCMPGGKVVVYTGLLPVARTETGLAVVMGHEIAHAVAKHGDERMSQALLAQLGGMALSEALKEKPEKTQQLWLSAFGVGAQIGVLLPFSRIHENEADHLGLIFMAIAGYDPHEAVDFWIRMKEQKKGVSPPEFLSTHPADEKRIKNIERLLPEAMKFYNER